MYTFQIDHLEYVAHRDGSPMTLVEAIRETQHVGISKVLRNGTPILRRGINSTFILRRGQWVER